MRKSTVNDSKRKRIPKKFTKAKIRQEFLNHCLLAKKHLELFNQTIPLKDRIRFLNLAIQTLESCLYIRPGHHLLRQQSQECKAVLQELQRCIEGSAGRQIRILFSPELFFQ